MSEAEAEAEPDLNNLERLILAQAVYELGSDSWSSVSDILSQHPLISKRDNATFSPLVSPSALHFLLPSNYSPIQACQNTYLYLLRTVGLDR